MSIIIFAILVLICTALVVAAIQQMPNPEPPSPFKPLIICLVLILAALVIAQHAGII